MFLSLFQVLNEFFHNVCELDLVFNFYKVKLMFVFLLQFILNPGQVMRYGWWYLNEAWIALNYPNSAKVALKLIKLFMALVKFVIGDTSD